MKYILDMLLVTDPNEVTIGRKIKGQQQLPTTTNNNHICIVCNEGTMCSETTETCSVENACFINCQSLRSCYVTTFECMGRYESCKESKIFCSDYGNRYVNVLGDYT